MKYSTWSALILSVSLFSFWNSFVSAEDNPAPPVNPDLTHGGQRDKSHDWLLGPTGARGWVYFRHEDLTAESRQILITAVDQGSPADGILQVNDVILGVNGQPFAADARKSFGQAITAAEEKSGMLKLIRWRAGKTENIELKLEVLGSYSSTAPYNCSKSQQIFERGIALIAKKGLKPSEDWIDSDLNALALLASGKKEYHPLLATYAKQVAESLHPNGTWTWFYGYGDLFIAEYILATGDQSLLPELKRTTMEMVRAQGAMGTWGHEFARADGNLNGYGCMNQPGIIVAMSLVLARDAGVKDPALDRAIEKSASFLRYYINKGAIPYGDHQPGANVHDDNGKCSSATVLFDLLRDREAVSFYSRMATAAYDEREHGHCGNYFNMLWALPGASRCGSLATGAYLKEQSWYYDLARNWHGGFNYQLIEEGEENDNYTNWDLTGSYLLSFGLPLKSLYLIGKKPCDVPPLNDAEVQQVIAAGRDFYPAQGKNGFDSRSPEKLLSELSSWSPAERLRAAQALGRQNQDVLPAVLKLLDTKDVNTRCGAWAALSCLGQKADLAAPHLRSLLNDPDPMIQTLACNALAALGSEARKTCWNDLLTLAAKKNPNDPRGMVNRAVAAALFGSNPDLHDSGILPRSLQGVDRQLLYPAIETILQNDDSLARYCVAPYLKQLTNHDLSVLLPSIMQSIEKLAPSNEMFADGIRTAGLDLISSLHIREGLSLCVSVMEVERWNEEERATSCLEYLKRYGKHAVAVVPQLQQIRRKMAKQNPESNLLKLIDSTIAHIKASKESPALIDLKDFIANPPADASPAKRKK